MLIANANLLLSFILTSPGFQLQLLLQHGSDVLELHNLEVRFSLARSMFFNLTSRNQVDAFSTNPTESLKVKDGAAQTHAEGRM